MQDIGLGKDFLKKRTEAEAVRLESCRTAKDNVKGTPTARERISADHATDKALPRRTYTEPRDSTTKQSVRRCAQDEDKHFSNDRVKMADVRKNAQVSSHQGNAKKNHNEVLLHPRQNVSGQK